MTDGNTYAIKRHLAEREEHDMREVFEAALQDAEEAQAYAEELEARVAELEAECWRMKEDRDRAIGWRDSDQARADAAEAELFEIKNAPISFLLDHGKGE